MGIWSDLSGGGGGGSGDVTGPASSTDNAIARFNGTSGKTIQNSSATIDDSGVLSTAELNLTTALDETYGGTGQSTLTSGDILYASALNTFSKLAIGSENDIMLVSSGVPSWTAQTSITSLGTITTGTWNGTDIAVADGGSGRGTATAYAVICGGTTATGAHQSIASVGTSGQVLTSNGPSALPTFQAASGGGWTWSEVTGTSQAMAVDNAYIANNASLVTLTLPDTAAIGERVKIVGKGAGLFKIAQNAGETIYYTGGSTTTGATGSLEALQNYASITLVCITANTNWVIEEQQGTVEVV